jgi:D-serine deaminase-like pyridoxal phosphate-dependent protein
MTHDPYFSGLSEALTRARIAQPTLVVDRQRMLANADAALALLQPANLDVRIVVKSLPNPQILMDLSERLRTRRFMVFNGAMLGQMARLDAGADLLLGKPLPVEQMIQFHESGIGATSPAASPQWLIDTPERLIQYMQAARERDLALRVNFEINVGLHRGGFDDGPALRAALDLTRNQPGVEVSGLMGYDPHLARSPRRDAGYERAQAAYRQAVEVITEFTGKSAEQLCLNSAGSPTYSLHVRGTAANEVSIGSSFVKPLDFDLDTLAHHQPASFIATPVIKVMQRPADDGAGASALFKILGEEAREALYIYGGHWLAQPVSPSGLGYSPVFGRSSNQELLVADRETGLRPDDFVFLRPDQSEAIFLQFGDLAIYEGGEICARWPTFAVSA